MYEYLQRFRTFWEAMQLMYDHAINRYCQILDAGPEDRGEFSNAICALPQEAGTMIVVEIQEAVCFGVKYFQ